MRSRGRRGSRGLRTAVSGTVAAMALALLPSCGEDRPWADQAVQWIEAKDRAAHRSVAELVTFESPDIVHVLCCNQLTAGPLHGREESAAFVGGMFGGALPDQVMMGRAYIDVSDSVVEYRFPAGPDLPPHPVYYDELQPTSHRFQPTPSSCCSAGEQAVR